MGLTVYAHAEVGMSQAFPWASLVRPAPLVRRPSRFSLLRDLVCRLSAFFGLLLEKTQKAQRKRRL